ncbi:MAG: HaeII family restriction endonuclease, partial [Nitrososphaerales archaeon]
GQRVQAIIVESQLVEWYDKALRGKYSAELGNDLLFSLKQEFKNEFPYSSSFEGFYKEREYDKVPKSNSVFWQAD